MTNNEVNVIKKDNCVCYYLFVLPRDLGAIAYFIYKRLQHVQMFFLVFHGIDIALVGKERIQSCSFW
jgi:hypothetical protein